MTGTHVPAGDILVLGLAASGKAVARYLAARMAEGTVASVTLAESKDSPELRMVAEELEDLGVRVVLGADSVDGHYSSCVTSPGIPPSSPLRISAMAVCDEFISEPEFAWRLTDKPWIAVTGTNGKTTTTALVAHLLRAGSIRGEAMGNIGYVATEAVQRDDIDVFVAELGSFQLSRIDTFHPKVAVLLNITPDHVDWHGSLERYTADKTRVFENMDQSDLAVIDVDDPGSAPFAEILAGRGVPVARVSRQTAHDGGAALVGGYLTLLTEGGPIRLVRPDELCIRGMHNVSNALAAAAAAHAFGVEVSDLREGLRTFEPIAHRLEPAGVIAGVEYVNDSKATNPDAVYQALRAFEGRDFIVLLGGRNKNNDFHPLAIEVAKTAKAAVLFGECRQEFVEAFAGADVPIEVTTTLLEATHRAAELAEPGDIVVLSPACASFDEFERFEHRGDEFKRYVSELEEGA